MIRAFISCIAILAVAGCGGSGPVDKQAANTAGLPDISGRGPSASGEPHVKTTPASTTPAPAPLMKIPAALQGRWGLTPADCTSALGDAKGLLVINSNELRFYESRAVPAASTNADSASISGNFTFTGEGQTWSKYESLKVDKQTLVRTEINPMASFTYAKCS